jgi:hypothetical protein
VLALLLCAAGSAASPAAHGASGADGWPALPAVPRARVEIVADDIEFNGLPMRIQRFTTPASADEVTAAAVAFWTRGYDQPPARTAVREATIVSQVHGPYLMTLKVAPVEGGGSAGLLAASRPLGARGARRHDVAPDVPLPAGTRVQSVVQSRDAGRIGRQVVARVPSSPEQAARQLDAGLQARGWHRVHDSAAPAGRFTSWQRAGREVSYALAAGPTDRRGAHSSRLVMQITSDGQAR